MKRIGKTGVQGFVTALAIHVLGIGGLFLVSPPERSRASVRPPVKIRVASRPPAPPAAVEPPAPRPEPQRPAEAEPRRPPRRTAAIRKRTPPPAAEPVRAEARPSPGAVDTPPEPAAAPRKFTVALEATVPGGGVAVPAEAGGGWAFGAPDGDPRGEKKLAGLAPEPIEQPKPPPRAIEAAAVTRLPRLVASPSAAELRSAYPEAARREGLEANVYLRILVGADGKVESTRVVRGAGRGFDQAAIEQVKRFRFQPAEAGGRAVSVWIPWTYKFRLEG